MIYFKRLFLGSLYLVDRASFINSFYFFFQLDTLIFSFFTFTIFLYMFRTGWSIIRRIKCSITQPASGTVPLVVDVSCVAVGVRLTKRTTHDTKKNLQNAWEVYIFARNKSCQILIILCSTWNNVILRSIALQETGTILFYTTFSTLSV